MLLWMLLAPTKKDIWCMVARISIKKAVLCLVLMSL